MFKDISHHFKIDFRKSHLTLMASFFVSFFVYLSSSFCFVVVVVVVVVVFMTKIFSAETLNCFVFTFRHLLVSTVFLVLFKFSFFSRIVEG